MWWLFFFPLCLFRFSVVIRLFLAPNKREKEGRDRGKRRRKSLEKTKRARDKRRRGRGKRGWRGRKRRKRLRQGAGRREAGRGADADENENVAGERTLLSEALLSVLRMMSQLILLSPNLSCKRDSVKTATVAAKDCVIRESY